MDTTPNDELIAEMGKKARWAALEMAVRSSEARAVALTAVADALEAASGAILEANAGDIESARAAGLPASSLDRLKLDDKRLTGISTAVRAVAALKDSVGEIIREWMQPNGICISKIRTPIGVVGIIYESRPNVTADAAALCLKTGNATILRGGSESIRSNTAIADALRAGLGAADFPVDAVQLVPTTDRAAVVAMAEAQTALDVIIPRGGKGLIETVVKHARMPVIKHYEGICSVYVHADADPQMAAAIAINSKCQRPGVCNAMETLLIDRAAAETFWDAACEGFAAEGVEIRADEETRAALRERGYPKVVAASDADFETEFLDRVMAVRLVDGVESAIEHINRHGSHHSDAIIAREAGVAERFLAGVDSAAVYWNASTRFTDGGEFGFGAEIGISTDKLHARGPMGLEELTSYKYVVRGDGQIRQ
jgi:glutamate-5-semialdehyde dehydrogenase